MSGVDPAAGPLDEVRATSPLFTRGELATAAAALGLVGCLVAVPWYGVSGTPGTSRAGAGTLDGWQALTLVRWLVLATALLALASLPLHVSQRRHGARTDTSGMVALLSTVTAALLVYRVLIELPRPATVVDQKLGAMLGLACAHALAASAWRWVRAVRARARAQIEPAHRRLRSPAAAP